MKTSPQTIKYALHPDEAATAVGSSQLLRAMVAASWIEPVIKRHKLTLYDREDLARCWERLRKGERPGGAEQRTSQNL